MKQNLKSEMRWIRGSAKSFVIKAEKHKYGIDHHRQGFLSVLCLIRILFPLLQISDCAFIIWIVNLRIDVQITYACGPYFRRRQEKL